MKDGTLQNACTTRPRVVAGLGKNAHMHTVRLMNSPNHGPVGRRSSNARQLGCVFQDMEPPKLSSILRKSSDMQKPIQRVKFAKAAARHTKIRDQNPSLGYICPGGPHERTQRSKIRGSVSGGDRVARARCPRSSVEAGQKCAKEQHSSHLQKIGAWLHQLLNLRNEYLLSTPARRCT